MADRRRDDRRSGHYRAGVDRSLSTVYGVSAEYDGGAGWQLLPLLLVAAGVAAGLAAWSWPGAPTVVRVVAPLAVVATVGLGGVVADRFGDLAHDQRLLSGSESFGCNGPNAEIEVDGRVDAVWAALPRRAPIYGPVHGSRFGCTAAVDGTGAGTFAAYAGAFRDLEGWTVTIDRADRFAMRQDGLRVVMWLEGAPDRLTMIEVRSVRNG